MVFQDFWTSEVLLLKGELLNSFVIGRHAGGPRLYDHVKKGGGALMMDGGCQFDSVHASELIDFGRTFMIELSVFY